MRKKYQKPLTRQAECVGDLMTTIVDASTITDGPPTEVDPIHPRDPGESLARERDEWEMLINENQEFEFGSLW